MVIGIPTKYPLVFRTLKRASLKAPQIINKIAVNKPIVPGYSLNTWEYINIAGATPNETRSHNESNSLPISEVVFSLRATLPSILSIRTARKIKIVAAL
jgi:hypothetical protein